MVSEPVTLGGGMAMTNGALAPRGSAAEESPPPLGCAARSARG